MRNKTCKNTHNHLVYSRTRRSKDRWVVLAELPRKELHDAINLLSLAGKSELGEEVAEEEKKREERETETEAQCARSSKSTKNIQKIE